MKIDRFEDIISWQKAKSLSVQLYQHFQHHKDFAFKDQLLRAGISVMNNIAEGFERQTNKEFRQFLFIAKGSCGEVRSMLILGNELGKISAETFEELYKETMEISKLISGLIKKL